MKRNTANIFNFQCAVESKKKKKKKKKNWQIFPYLIINRIS